MKKRVLAIVSVMMVSIIMFAVLASCESKKTKGVKDFSFGVILNDKKELVVDKTVLANKGVKEQVIKIGNKEYYSVSLENILNVASEEQKEQFRAKKDKKSGDAEVKKIKSQIKATKNIFVDRNNGTSIINAGLKNLYLVYAQKGSKEKIPMGGNIALASKEGKGYKMFDNSAGFVNLYLDVDMANIEKRIALTIAKDSVLGASAETTLKANQLINLHNEGKTKLSKNKIGDKINVYDSLPFMDLIIGLGLHDKAFKANDIENAGATEITLKLNYVDLEYKCIGDKELTHKKFKTSNLYFGFIIHKDNGYIEMALYDKSEIKNPLLATNIDYIKIKEVID